ncbi:MAG: PD40 domain-containing protein [Prevotella sp.]|nr:PD40 domain-containing protein [Prevotella sp.]
MKTKAIRTIGQALLSAVAVVMAACQGATVPQSFTTIEQLPAIYPDYVDVTVPVNIAPLTFELEDSCDDAVTRFSYADCQIVCGGMKAQPDPDDWRELVSKAAGNAIGVEVFAQQGGQWTRYRQFSINVSPDSIDPYISYRLISPSYVTYEELTLNQRCLENYDERVMVDNMLCGLEKTGQCVNCHNYQQYNPQRMQFHARQFHGGTIVAYDGKIKKVNMRNDSIISAGVYPAWHPWLPLIVYSTNKTGQSFHTRNLNKIEVFDSASDLIAYDVERNLVTNLENDTTEFEVFPAWAPDGRTLYYCSAHFEFRDTVSADVETILRSKEVKYNLYKKSFDPQTLQFGPREMVFRADTLNLGNETDSLAIGGCSATLPRVSPDGRFLMFTLGRYGVFHIWHREANLYLMDLKTGEVRPMDEINSPETESYHSWSSNGRWVVFSSRRDDGGYTRPFIAHIDQQGRGSKPFELPQADPDYHRQFMKSYNIPEFMSGPVEISPQQFADVLKASDGEPVTYIKNLSK